MAVPVVSGLRVKAPASLIGIRTYLITVLVGTVLSVTAAFAIFHFNDRSAAEQRERQLQRLTQLAGMQVTLQLKQALNTTADLARLVDGTAGSTETLETELAGLLDAQRGLNGVLWLTATATDTYRIVHSYPPDFPLDIPRTALTLKPVNGTAPGVVPRVVTTPSRSRPHFNYALTLAPVSESPHEATAVAVFVDFAQFYEDVTRTLRIDELRMRIHDAPDSAAPRRAFFNPNAIPAGMSRSTELNIGAEPWLLEIYVPPGALGIAPGTRSPWIALGVGLLLTAIALSYLAVLQRHALRFAQIQQKLGKKMARQARQEAEQDLRVKSKAIEASHNGILITDATAAYQPIIYVNKACERMTGYSLKELEGRSPDLLLAHENNQPAIIKLRTAIKDGQSGSAAVRCYRKDGSMFWNELSVSPVTDRNGRITHYLSVMSDITDRKRFADQLLYQATHDQLTGLPNRNLMQDRFAQALAHARRNRTICGLLLLNVDRLKAVNETLGHRFGNQILKGASERLIDCARSCDTVARLSGDEFVLVLPELGDANEMLVVAQRILQAFKRPFTAEAHELTVTCSIGGSAFPKDGADTESLLRNADIAMGRAKHKGKNRFEFFTDEMNVNAIDRLKLENDLRYAVENGELLLHYQPRVDLNSGHIVGLEALVRWQHPDRGMIPPGDFIPLAEELGLIPHIGDWVLHAACNQLYLWQKENLRDITVAVNLSALQIQRRELHAEIETALQDFKLSGRNLELEITESTVMENAADTVQILERLKSLEVQLAIDDFGTGYSSLAYLRRFPFDYLKIDRSFIANLTRDPDEASIARTIIAMAHSLRMKVIAEGVETEAQARYLQRNQCDEIQGFLFSRAVTVDTITGMLLNRHNLYDNMAMPRKYQRSVLIVDDEVNSLNALRRVLRGEGYRVLTTPSPLEGLELLATEGAEVVISDQRMPEMSGVEFLTRVRDLHPTTIRIELTGSTDIQAAADLVNRGAIFRFLTKPCDDEDLRRNVREAFQHYESVHGSLGATPDENK